MANDSLVDIDPLALDREWVGQASLFRKWAERLADAKKDWEDAKIRKDLAEDQMELIEAKIDLEVRKNPVNFGLESTTEKSIRNVVISDKRSQAAKKEVYKAQQEIVQAKHLVDTLESAVKSLEHRKTALENLVYLHGQNYYSQPRAPKEVREEVGERSASKVFGKHKRVRTGE